ncbi:unnamed protein product [Sphenostylis stenocarpa]|uniref:Uncharacterized protein n=1 Tax=Sphenostylis stenocarpa TaxID=92480 RepID=A0AA86RZ47_9FABA|nr:unnamed protein product [Sphenostylis stenocarpa]
MATNPYPIHTISLTGEKSDVLGTAFVACAFSSLHNNPKTSFTQGMNVPKYGSPISK